MISNFCCTANEALFPPKAEAPVYLLQMMGMALPLNAIAVDLFEKDFENVARERAALLGFCPFWVAHHIAMSVKYLLFALMVLVGLVITLVLGPKMSKLSPQPGEKPPPGFLKTQRWIGSFALVNMILGVLVLLALAWV